MTPDIADAEARVRALTDAEDDLAAVIKTGETEAAEYHLAIVHRPHPDEAGQVIIMERYAQLAAEWSDMDDTWMKNGINRRVEAGNGAVPQALAQAYAGLSAQMNAGSVGDREVFRADPGDDDPQED